MIRPEYVEYIFTQHRPSLFHPWSIKSVLNYARMNGGYLVEITNGPFYSKIEYAVKGERVTIATGISKIFYRLDSDIRRFFYDSSEEETLPVGVKKLIKLNEPVKVRCESMPLYPTGTSYIFQLYELDD